MLENTVISLQPSKNQCTDAVHELRVYNASCLAFICFEKNKLSMVWNTYTSRPKHEGLLFVVDSQQVCCVRK